MTVKHVGTVGTSGTKVLVAMRTLPGEPTNALVIPTAALKQTYHDELDSLVMKEEAQQAFEFATILNVRKFFVLCLLFLYFLVRTYQPKHI